MDDKLTKKTQFELKNMQLDLIWIDSIMFYNFVIYNL